MIFTPLILLFIVTAFQDFRDRAISWFLPLLICTVGLVNATINEQLDWLSYSVSFVFIVAQITVIYLYLVFKTRSWKVDLTNHYLGWGDILFFIAVIPLFDYQSFVFLFLGGMLFTLIGQLILNSFKRSKTVPLAGWLSVFYSLFYSIKIIY